MNKVVREHYPVANLPEDLQREFAGFDTVKIVTEDDNLTGLAAVEAAERKYQEHLRQILDKGAIDLNAYRGSVSIEEAVARIRAVRDESPAVDVLAVAQRLAAVVLDVDVVLAHCSLLQHGFALSKETTERGPFSFPRIGFAGSRDAATDCGRRARARTERPDALG